MTDCLIVGMNSLEFPFYLQMVKSMGEQGGAYRDLNLSFIELEGRPYQALELLSKYYVGHGGVRKYPFHNADFIWPSITYLGTYLHRRGFSFDWVNAFQHEQDAFREKLLADDIELIAITTALYVVPWPIQQIIKFIRQYNQRVKIVVGGPYISNSVKGAPRADMEAQFDALGADYYVVSSEGEQALVKLLTAIKGGGDFAGVHNLAHRVDGQWVFNPSITERNDLHENPVDYTLFGRERLGQFVSTRTAKSCPFSCSFCNFPEQAGAYTYTPTDYLERELDALRELGGVTTLTFIDDTFNVPKSKFKDVLRMMIRKKYDFRWNCNFRCDNADDEAIDLMAEAGCEGVFLGVESGSPAQLKRMNKTAKREDFLWAIPRLREVGILTHANTFIGFPGETLDSVAETVDLIQRTEPDTFSVQPWYANPLTPIFRQKENYKIVGSSFQWAHETMDAATACDLVDHVFKSVDASVFLPQYGFFQWSLFYLRALGMPVPRIKNYLRIFNALVRDKMMGHPDPDTKARLLSTLEETARFDGPEEPPPAVVDLRAGRRREAADAYCRREFLVPGGAPSVRALEDGLASGDSGWTRVELPLAPEWSGELVRSTWSVLAWRLNGLDAVPMLTTNPAGAYPRLVPVMVRADAALPLAEHTRSLGALAAEAGEHGLFALDLLTQPGRHHPLYAARPRFVVAFEERASVDEVPHAATIPLGAEAVLVAQLVVDAGGRRSAHVWARASGEVAARVAQHLGELLTAAAREPGAALGDLGVGTTAPRAAAVSALRADEFAF